MGAFLGCIIPTIGYDALMRMTPRMVVLTLLAIATITVLSLTAIGGRFIAQRYVQQHPRSTTSATPTPTPIRTQPPATAVVLITALSAQFPDARVLSAGRNPVVFINVATDDTSAIAAAINTSVTNVTSLGGSDTITLIINKDGMPYSADKISALVTHSTATANQLLITLG